MSKNANVIVSAIVGVCSGITSANAINGLVNLSQGKDPTEKQTDLIFGIGVAAISSVIGAVVGKKTKAFMDGTNRVTEAIKDKITSDITVQVEPVADTEADPYENFVDQGY